MAGVSGVRARIGASTVSARTSLRLDTAIIVDPGSGCGCIGRYAAATLRTHFSFPALLAAAALFTALAGAFAPQASAQATRTWVSGVGDDVNPCSRTAPCKTLAGSISKTAAGGEINALDGGGFGAVTITKAITIDLAAVPGGVLNTGTNGIIVNAQSTDDVVLRGLDVAGATGAAGCGYGGLNGVRVLKARTVRIEDSRIGRQQKGIELNPTSPVKVLVNRVDIANNCTHGIASAPGVGGAVELLVRDSTITNSGTALSVADNAAAWLTGSTIFGNALGLEALGAGAINDFGDNHLVGNAVDGAPTKHVGVTAPAGPAGATGPTGPAGPRGEPGVKLLVAASATRLVARAGKRVSLRYLSTVAATSTLHVRRAGKRVATVRAAARSGANTINWNGRIGKKPARAGSYRLTLRAVGADGQSDTTTATLKLKPR
jgi:hypothetical protein